MRRVHTGLRRLDRQPAGAAGRAFHLRSAVRRPRPADPRAGATRWRALAGLLALATAFGTFQAGVIDQSLFNDSYRDISYWHDMIAPTWIEPLGISANTTLAFVLGHTIWSFGAPIALTEAIGPKPVRPWLGWPGLIVTTVLYLVAACVVLIYHLRSEEDQASPAQLAGALVVVAALTVFAFTLGRRERPRVSRRVPPPLVLGVLSLLVSFGFNMLGASLPATIGLAAIALAAVVGVSYPARSRAWTGRHLAALASGTLLGRVVIGFLTNPLGDVTPLARLGHNVTFLLMALGLGVWAHLRNRSDGRPTAESG